MDDNIITDSDCREILAQSGIGGDWPGIGVGAYDDALTQNIKPKMKHHHADIAHTFDEVYYAAQLMLWWRGSVSQGLG